MRRDRTRDVASPELMRLMGLVHRRRRKSRRREVARSVSALLVLAFVTACGQSGGPARNASATEPVEAFLDASWPQGAGGTVVAARDGEMVGCKSLGWADKEAEVEATCDTVYDVMSMTKQFTAAGILKLEMMGNLDVTDPIPEHLGAVPGDKRGITVHQLLTHTAGLPASLGDDYAPLSRDQMVQGALESQLVSIPGDEYHYSNLGYSLLAAIIEVVSGQGYEEFLAANLFRPAGMTQTGYVLPAWSDDQVAVEYDSNGRPQGKPFERPWAADGPYWNLRGNGGLLSSARDMFKWHMALEGDEILDQPTRELLFTPYVAEAEDGDSFSGYGWVILPQHNLGQVAWHNGGNGLSYGELLRSTDDDVMVFWISNHAYQEGSWNLEEQGQEITDGVTERLA